MEGKGLESDGKTKCLEPTAVAIAKRISEKEKLEMEHEEDGVKSELATSAMDYTLPSISPSFLFSSSSIITLDENEMESDEKTELFEPTATSGPKKSEKEKLEMGHEEDRDKTELDTSAMNSSHTSIPRSSTSAMLDGNELETDGKTKWFKPTATAEPKKSEKEKLEMEHEEDGVKSELVTSAMISALPSKSSCTAKDLPTLMARSTSTAVFKQSERKHITELLSEVRAAENPSLFHADDGSSDEIDCMTDELEALRREKQALVKEASYLQIRRTKQAARHAAQRSVLQVQIESIDETAKNLAERKKSVLKKFRDQKKERQTLKKEIKECVEQIDIPKCLLKTFVKLSDDAVCTDKMFCDVFTSGTCFPTDGPKSKDTTK